MIHHEPCPVCHGRGGQHKMSCRPQNRLDATLARVDQVKAEYPGILEHLREARDSDDEKRSAAARWLLDLLSGQAMPAGWTLHVDESRLTMPMKLVRDADGKNMHLERDEEGWE